MKNNKIFFLILSFVFCMFCACEDNEDGFYDNVYRIYFPEETDSLNFTFGDKLQEYHRHIINLPVRLMGVKTTRELKFKVEVDTASTAEEGVHFAEIQSEYTFLVDSVNAYIPIELIRDNLSDGYNAVYKIVLNLVPSDDFQLGSKQHLQGIITFNNFLEEPSWWYSVFGYSYALYHPGMYQRLIAYFGGPLEEDYVWANYLKMMYVFKHEVFDYAQAHPELTSDWQFKPDMWFPFD